MPYTTPTPAEFKTRFPAFADTDDERIAIFIADAERKIDNTWRVQDYQPAILYLAAHLLTLSGGEDGDDPVGDATTGDVVGESFGQMSISYAKKAALNAPGSSAWQSTYGTTPFGREFLSLARGNKPPVVAI